ncbi:MAG: hypothetical protein ABIO04_06355 [Ferruginibacter sp.]
MKKVIIYILIINFISINCYSQNAFMAIIDSQAFTILKLAARDVVTLKASVWDEMVKGTKFTSVNLKEGSLSPVYIEIADKRFLCQNGIGFSCSIFDRTEHTSNWQPVNNKNRIAAANLQLAGNDRIMIYFLETVDWCSLQNDE